MEPVLGRGERAPWVVHIDSGRVALGLLDGDKLAHQLGVVQGPAWLDAGAAVLNLPSLVDAVAQTDVFLRRMPVAQFSKVVAELPPLALALVRDMALAHRQQTELAVSRLVKDAESRCAEWLLARAQETRPGEWLVQLEQRKRAIAAQLGIAPETLSRVLRQLRERGLIVGGGRTLRLPSVAKLHALAGG